MAKRKKKFTDGMSKPQIERLSKSNATKIINGTDKLRSWGKSGFWKCQRLNRYFHFRSMLEANVLRTLDEAKDFIVDFDTEKFAIPYDFKGVTLNYVPDVILKTSSGKVYVVEVKPSTQLEEEKNLAKWVEAKRWCWEKGIRFFVITEKDYPKIIEILKAFEDKDISGAKKLLEWTG